MPIKPQRVYEEMNQAFGQDTRYVSHHRAVPDRRRPSSCTSTSRGTGSTAARPARWAGPLPAALGVATADPDATVVALSGDYDFQFMIEELAVGAQFKMPYIHVLVNNAYLGLIRQSQRGFDMDYHVQLSFDNVNCPGARRLRRRPRQGRRGLGLQGDPGLRARRASLPALEKAKKLMHEHRVPVVVEVILERVTNISMGAEIDNVVEFEELAERGEDAPTAIAARWTLPS